MNKVLKTIYAILVFNIFVVSNFFDSNAHGFKYDNFSDMPAVKFIGYNLLILSCLLLLQILCNIWEEES